MRGGRRDTETEEPQLAWELAEPTEQRHRERVQWLNLPTVFELVP